MCANVGHRAARPGGKVASRTAAHAAGPRRSGSAGNASRLPAQLIDRGGLVCHCPDAIGSPQSRRPPRGVARPHHQACLPRKAGTSARRRPYSWREERRCRPGTALCADERPAAWNAETVPYDSCRMDTTTRERLSASGDEPSRLPSDCVAVAATATQQAPKARTTTLPSHCRRTRI